jgi:dTDP-4-dehydrorhamnose reductase
MHVSALEPQPGLSVLVTGATGMVGQTVFRVLGRETLWSVIATQRSDANRPYYLDAEAETTAWQSVIINGRFSYIVNCTGILKSAIEDKKSETVARAIAVNSLFPHRLALTAAEAGSRVIHVSTDAVFSETSGLKVESDVADCCDTYGRTKVLGESAARNVVNIRCSIVGRDPLRRKGILEWLLSHPEDVPATGFLNQLWNGVSANQLAEVCRLIIKSGEFDGIRRVSGVHHFCPNPTITKYDLLCFVKEAARSKVEISPIVSGRPTNRLLGTQYSELSSLFPNTVDWLPVISEAVAIQQESRERE